MVEKRKKAEGFTIVEVLIVLAIAGLIMAVVFIAVPHLERSQRDAKREAIARSVAAEIETYANNNQGVYPFSVPGTFAYPHNRADCQPVPSTGCYSDFINRYINGIVNTDDPTTNQPMLSGADYQHGVPIEWPDPPTPADASTVHTGELYIEFGARCNGEGVVSNGVVSPSSHSYSYAILVGLDRNNTAHCIDNS